MNVLEMTDSELYEIGIKILTEKLGDAEVPRFIRQCKPGKGDYSVDRHKLLADQPDIATIVKQIEDKREVWEAEERERAKRFAAPQSEIRKMTDIEIFEIGNQVLMNKLGPAGSIGFTWICQELNGGYPRGLIKNAEEAKEYIKIYTASLTFNPKIVEDYIKRGNAYNYIGEHDKAIADYDQAIKLKPDYAKAYYNRGNAYRDKVDFDQAIADYTKAIELDPDYVEAYYNRGKLYVEDDAYDKAIGDFGMTIKFDPEHSDAHGYRADLYRDIGEYDKAIAGYNMEMELCPGNPEVYYNRGTVYAKKGEYDKTIEDFSKAIELHPEFAEVYVKRALVYIRIGKFDRAIQDYDKVLELKPKSIAFYAARGIMSLHIEEWESAKLDLTFARNSGVDIIKVFHQIYASVLDFEQTNGVQLPEDIAVMLRRW